VLEDSAQTRASGGGARERARPAPRAAGPDGDVTGGAVTCPGDASVGGAGGVAGWNGDVTCVCWSGS
jgi:hypothetical protein